MKDMFIKYLWILVIVACIFALLGCGQVPLSERVIKQHESSEVVEEKQIDTHVPNFQGIADAIGCVFAPQSCQK